MFEKTRLTPPEQLHHGFVVAQLDKREDGPRKIARWPAKCTLQGGVSIDATLENVSPGGVCFRSQQDPAKFGFGDPKKLRMYFQVDGFMRGKPYRWSAVLKLRHVSISNNEYRCGCSFLSIKPEYRRMLHCYIHNIENTIPNLCTEHN